MFAAANTDEFCCILPVLRALTFLVEPSFEMEFVRDVWQVKPAGGMAIFTPLASYMMTDLAD